MSSGQSAAGTRTWAGNPAADWLLANREDVTTSGGLSGAKPACDASGHTPAAGASVTACAPSRRGKT